MIKPHRRHGFYVLVMVIGWVLPPIAVLLRFGFGTDFFLNILLTLAGYIPGHGHNFYLQNIRNNSNRKRTPTWASRAGLVKDPMIARRARTQWANRYDERTPTRADGYQDEEPESTPTSSSSLEPRELVPRSAESDGYFVTSTPKPDSHRNRLARTRSTSAISVSQKSASVESSIAVAPVGGRGREGKVPRRSLSQKLGFGRKSEKKNRFDRTNEARALQQEEWNYINRPHPNSHPEHSTEYRGRANDGLDHVF